MFAKRLFLYIVYNKKEMKREGREKKRKRPDGSGSAAPSSLFLPVKKLFGDICPLPNLAIHEIICLHGYARVNYSIM